MKLSSLLEGVRVTKMFQTMFGRMVVTHDVEVSAIQYDSRKIGRGDCFVAIRGMGVDGHRFVQDAIGRGASVVLLEDDSVLPDSLCMHAGVVKIVVGDSRKALAQMAANYYGHPSGKMTLVGITGTNGKTTTSHLVRSILEHSGRKTGLIGTINYQIGGEVIPATHTTPESLELQKLLARMSAAGCTSVSMEVSSHALVQSRVAGIQFTVAVFTNLTQDHLDYHKTMDAYFDAKKSLFEMLAPGGHVVTNRDDDWGRKIFAAGPGRSLSYGFEAESDVRVVSADLSIQGTVVKLNYRSNTTTITTSLVGRFNVYNIAAAYAVGVALNLPDETIRRGIEQTGSVKGRFETVISPTGWTAVIDYAHTPDALDKCLRTIHEVLPGQQRGKIITVFGAGGDRDTAKRPMMGAVAVSLSDQCIVTSDNPRTENPDKIIEDILAGAKDKKKVSIQPDRHKAIVEALTAAGPGDVVLIAGKGHEEYQVLGTEKIHFSDREVVEEFLRSH